MYFKYFLFCCLGLLCCGVGWSETSPESEGILFQENFEEMETEGLPREFLVLDGEFTVQEIEGNRVVHLPGDPLGDYGFLFGPNAKEDLEVQARIRSESRRRLTPRFGVGLNGVNAYKLYLIPNKNTLEIWKGKEMVQEVESPFRWESGSWTWFVLQVISRNGVWLVQGKVWQEDDERPEEWMIQYEEKAEPVMGKASIWGTPYSARPILFDDILVRQVKP
ncbi:MAG: hypothetical protein ACOX5R_19360 [bacterium]|jgi:hypothetical protein